MRKRITGCIVVLFCTDTACFYLYQFLEHFADCISKVFEAEVVGVAALYRGTVGIALEKRVCIYKIYVSVSVCKCVFICSAYDAFSFVAVVKKSFHRG